VYFVNHIVNNSSWYYGYGQYPTPLPLYFRVERDGGILTAYWSDDGLVWNSAWSYDMGNLLDRFEQRVVLAGLCWFNPSGSYADWDYVSLTPTIVPVQIDIKPGSESNAINPENKGVIPVAILTTTGFNAARVDPLSVAFGPNGAKARNGKGLMEDADRDGDLDMVLQFPTHETGIKCGDIEAQLTGKTTSGMDIKGTDAIITAGCNSKKSAISAPAETDGEEGYAHYPNSPNPVISETAIRFILPEDIRVVINIYNNRGETIRTLVNEQYPAGEHRVIWDGNSSSGSCKFEVKIATDK